MTDAEKRRDAKERLAKKSIQRENGCIEWQGAKGHNSYGRISFDGKIYSTHRLAWLLNHGDPGDKFVCHKCDNRRCLNVEHLFLGTHSENMRDSLLKGRNAFARRTHCKHGHSLSDAYQRYDKRGKNFRMCRECTRIKSRKDYERRKEKHESK